MSSHTGRRGLGAVWPGLLAAAVSALVPVAGRAGGTDARAKVAFLAARPEPGKPDAGIDMALEAAQRVTPLDELRPAGDGRFLGPDGTERPLAGFGVVWCHRDDTGPPAGPLFDPRTVAALKRFVHDGHGLLLSGTATALAGPLGVDAVEAAPLTFGNDRDQAGLIPLDPPHPAFAGADLDRGTLWFTNAAFPAFAALRPARGAILARTPGGAENPLVEYAPGKGRAILLAWRVGRMYGDAPATYRHNFETLAGNLVRYLGDPPSWRPLNGAPRPAAPAPAVTASEWRALEDAVHDLVNTYGVRYPRGPEYLARIAALKADPAATAGRFRALRDEALLANPLLDFSRLLLVRRGAGQLGLPMNYESNSSLPKTGYDNEIAVLSPVRPGGRLTTLYRPEGGRFVGDVDLHFDAGRLLFSTTGTHGRWQVCEIGVDGTGLRELPLIREPDVDNYDACYLPDGGVAFCSTACFTGVPCVNGVAHVCNLYRLGPRGGILQLTVEQDHDWCPTVTNDGRLLYLRWEYTDLPHAFSRILFQMNPDGTGQSEFYGSGSYWPASMFYARPIPGHPTRVVAVAGGHHEEPRAGDLVIFDRALGHSEAEGAVQRIPGAGRPVVPVVADLPIAQTWPKFLHPYPLSDKYFLVSCKPSADARWGIYLVDVFDNMVLLCEQAGSALFEPVPVRKVPRPPVIPDRVDPARGDAEVFVGDVYRGAGLAGVPRGTVRSLRVIGYEFAYQGMGAEPYSVGLDGPWDPKRVLGTVPVHPDGSAHFRVPAYTPVALQPLDAEGKAVQTMRSWFTAMPGEVVSCVGCHESPSTAAPVQVSSAGGLPPADITPWHGPARGFSFRREVQPVLDRSCVGCHDGKTHPGGESAPDLTDREPVPALPNDYPYNTASRFSPSYYQLRRFVRTPTKESDRRVLMPWEFHADTTRLIQMLRKGHHGVTLDAESWDRLVTWIDLNAPAHGSWDEIRGREIGPLVRHQQERRAAMRARHATTGANPHPRPSHGSGDVWTTAGPSPPEAEFRPSSDTIAPPVPPALLSGTSTTIPLAPGVALRLAKVPAGAFVMGQDDGDADERPAGRVTIASPFWIGRCEVTNAEFALFDPGHDSRFEPADYIHFSPGERGWPVSRPAQPVVRVSWLRALAFCDWLSQRTGLRFTLPTEAQWEYACRAGTTTPFAFGPLGADFSPFANLSDASHQTIDLFSWADRANTLPAWRPADIRFDDRSRVSAPVGRYRPNPWGLFDLHGNAAEWTRTAYRPYPYADDGRDVPTPSGRKVVRGGSWYDPPARARSAFRQAYPAEQPVFDVGFRVVCEGPAAAPTREAPRTTGPVDGATVGATR